MSDVERRKETGIQRMNGYQPQPGTNKVFQHIGRIEEWAHSLVYEIFRLKQHSHVNMGQSIKYHITLYYTDVTSGCETTLHWTPYYTLAAMVNQLRCQVLVVV